MIAKRGYPQAKHFSWDSCRLQSRRSRKTFGPGSFSWSYKPSPCLDHSSESTVVLPSDCGFSVCDGDVHPETIPGAGEGRPALVVVAVKIGCRGLRGGAREKLKTCFESVSAI